MESEGQEKEQGTPQDRLSGEEDVTSGQKPAEETGADAPADKQRQDEEDASRG